ncbi:MAG: hypothetical protein U0O24_00605 [Eggerthellaceae bacterium]
MRYTCTTLKTKEHGNLDLEGVTTAMRKHLVDFLFDKQAHFQDFDADKTSTATNEKFFGSWSQFRKGILKEV